MAAGFAIAKQRQGQDAVVFVVTGDGAIEEGAFYESLVLMKSLSLRVVIVVENIVWALVTRISERRCPINLGGICGRRRCAVSPPGTGPTRPNAVSGSARPGKPHTTAGCRWSSKRC